MFSLNLKFLKLGSVCCFISSSEFSNEYVDRKWGAGLTSQDLLWPGTNHHQAPGSRGLREALRRLRWPWGFGGVDRSVAVNRKKIRLPLKAFLWQEKSSRVEDGGRSCPESTIMTWNAKDCAHKLWNIHPAFPPIDLEHRREPTCPGRF